MVTSLFATPEGRASVQAAGWALPVAAIDVVNPTESAGNGGLAIRTGPGLALGWRGPSRRPSAASRPRPMLSPGNICWWILTRRTATPDRRYGSGKTEARDFARS